MVQRQDLNVACLALFGSTARLTPGPESDADLLILAHNARLFYEVGKAARVMYLLREAWEAPEGQWCAWSFSAITSDAHASDLDEDFVAIVAHDGVLLYQQEGVALPPALAGLTPYAVWLKRVEALLDRCERLVADHPARV